VTCRGGCLISALDCLRLTPVQDESRQVDFSPVAIDDEKRVNEDVTLFVDGSIPSDPAVIPRRITFPIGLWELALPAVHQMENM
jgi:hypothetical protein